MLDALAEVGRNAHLVGLERALESRLELSLGVCGVQLVARDADPRAAARSTGANVGSDFTFGRESEPDQLVFRAFVAGEDAGAFRSVPRRRPGSRRRSLQRLPALLGPGLRRGTGIYRSAIIPGIPHRRPP